MIATFLFGALLVAALGQPLAGVVFVLDGVLIGAGDGTFLAWAGLAVLAAYAPAAIWAATLPHGLVAVWDAGTVTPTSTIALPLAVAASGAFLPDGRTARFLDWFTGTAYDWDLSTDSAVEFACRAVGRDLTREEWTENFGDLPYRETCPQ